MASVDSLQQGRVTATDWELGRRLDDLEAARARLQSIDFGRLDRPELAYRVAEVLALWDRVRLTVADVLAALPGGGE